MIVQVTGSLGREGRRPGQLSAPTALIRVRVPVTAPATGVPTPTSAPKDTRGRLVVADTGNDRVQVCTVVVVLVVEIILLK